MINRQLFTLIIALLPFLCKAQQHHQYDSILKSVLGRFIIYPNDLKSSGVNLIRVSKRDSLITLTSLYKSDNKLRLSKVTITGYINGWNSILKQPFSLVIPVYFQMADELPPSEAIKNKIKKLLRKLKRKEDVLEEGITIPKPTIYICY